MLAVVILLHIPLLSTTVLAEAVTAPAAYDGSPRPSRTAYDSEADYDAAVEAWRLQNQARSDLASAANHRLQPFYRESFQQFLTPQSGENLAWSPSNTWIALAMLAQTASGDTRREILDVLGAESLEDLRGSVKAIWESVYSESETEARILANSLWLDSSLECSQELADTLGREYYASAFRGDLGSAAMARDMQAWVTQHTGGFLPSREPDLALSQTTSQTLMMLLSTIYYRADWRIRPSDTTDGVFHAPTGDVTRDFMRYEKAAMTYSWGEAYGAVSLPTEGGTRMWLILPDEGCTVADVLESGAYLGTVMSAGTVRSDDYLVNLSLPKFDVKSSLDLREGLRNMGITDAFDPVSADFSEAFRQDGPVFVDQVRQATRVTVDEEGVEAASCIEIGIVRSHKPTGEIVDFVLDRPFLFVVEYEGIPLFAGVVNDP